MRSALTRIARAHIGFDDAGDDIPLDKLALPGAVSRNAWEES